MWAVPRIPVGRWNRPGELAMTEKVHVLNFLSDRSPAVAENDLQQLARQIGALAGRAVALLRQAQTKLNDQETWKDLRRSAEDRVQELRQTTVLRSQDWRREAENRYQEARRRARETVRDYPVHVAVAAGVAGFIVGAALRIRRSHRAG